MVSRASEGQEVGRTGLHANYKKLGVSPADLAAATSGRSSASSEGAGAAMEDRGSTTAENHYEPTYTRGPSTANFRHGSEHDARRP